MSDAFKVFVKFLIVFCKKFVSIKKSGQSPDFKDNQILRLFLFYFNQSLYGKAEIVRSRARRRNHYIRHCIV